ncbi:DUF2333 family protein [Alteromonas sediminis]|uniref:DUF2333 family protein n=1 Tax=Alteromonas sediminis TaxID=2259342 RepID=A0A3N5YBD1_9ALTE|nr:DUF2333 family protein [Alteromonas sediminis]RPJ66255.1 DUF2333 family protein [Alteromonas sediminis]
MNFQITKRTIASIVLAILVLGWLVGWYWSREPDTFDVVENAHKHSSNSTQLVAGQVVTSTLIEVTDTLLNKPGGYLANDVMPPSVFLDNMPSWEFGALEMVRDLALAMRKDFSRSQSQSVENALLIKAQPKLNIDHKAWLLPSAEGEYGEAIDMLQSFNSQLGITGASGSQFHTRADNLRDWLKQVEKRMGSLSQKLSASVGARRENTDLAGDAVASQSTPTPSTFYTRTSWWKLDDNFYEARGATWALLHFLKAVEVDFADVLQKKNAQASLRQIIRELEATQETVWSPIILNGDGFGIVANHSLVMANYISRANAALIELTELLSQG